MRGALLDKGLEFFLFPHQRIKTGEYFSNRMKPIEGAFKRILSVWNQPPTVRINRVCFESTASVSNQPRPFRISRVCFESTAPVSNQPRPFRINRVRFESTAPVSNQPRLFGINHACLESTAQRLLTDAHAKRAPYL